jgi:hypothetical protein
MEVFPFFTRSHSAQIVGALSAMSASGRDSPQAHFLPALRLKAVASRANAAHLFKEKTMKIRRPPIRRKM